MKILRLFLLAAMMAAHLANAASCPVDAPEKIYSYLKPQLPDGTWLDINPADRADNCGFVIRYYPCSDDIQDRIDTLLPQAVHAANPQCILKNAGEHVHTEGFCTLKGAAMRCR